MAIDGVTVPAFSAGTLPPPQEKSNLRDEVIASSRSKYATPRNEVEDYITEWSAPMDLSEQWQQEGGSKKAERSLSDRITPEGKKPEAVTVAPAQSQQVPEPVEEPIANETNLLLENRKIELLTDRFNRRWYSVSPPKDQMPTDLGAEESEKENNLTQNEPAPEIANTTPAIVNTEIVEPADTPTETESRGEVDNLEPLITWEKADELGLGAAETRNRPHESDDEFQPIDEL